MKKPLTKSVIKNEDVEEKPIDDDTKVLSQHGELKIPPKKYIFFLPQKDQKSTFLKIISKMENLSVKWIEEKISKNIDF